MKTRIFVIDDEPDVTHMLRAGLELTGYYHVGEENDPTVAVASARAFDPDVILLDIMMPDVDGTEVAARLRGDRALRDVPVLFVTALVSGGDAPADGCHGSWRSGGHTFLPKGMPLDRLIACVEHHLAEARRREAAAAAARDAAAFAPSALRGHAVAFAG